MVQRAGRRLEPAGHELVHEVLQLGDGERLGAVLADVGMDERRDQVVLRVLTAAFELGGEVMLRFEFGLDRFEHLLLGQRTHRHREHRARPAVEAMDVAAIEAELLGDDRAGERHREVHVELALPRLDQPVDQLIAHLVDVRGHLPDPLGEKRLGDQSSVRGVLRRIGPLQGLDVPPAPFAEDLLVAPRHVGLGLDCPCRS